MNKPALARTDNHVPAQPDIAITLPGNSMSPAMQIMLDERLFERAKQIATYMSKAEGFVPGHLLGKPEACFAVVTRSLTWKLDPFAVAQCTYTSAAGKVGFEGKLCQAIIENSGKVEGGVEYETYGDWSKVKGKFKMVASDKGNGKKYPVATYTEEDEIGLGVIAIAQVTGEKKPRKFEIDLRQAQPRNSTLWATDPLTQLKYRAARGLGNLAMPGIFMGVPFEREDYADMHMKDVTPEKPILDNINDAIRKEAGKDKPKTADVDQETGEVIDQSAGGSSLPTLQDWLDDITNIPTPEGLDHKFAQASEQFKGDANAMAQLTLAKTQRKQALSKPKEEAPVGSGSRKLFEKPATTESTTT
jgi:RecT family